MIPRQRPSGTPPAYASNAYSLRNCRRQRKARSTWLRPASSHASCQPCLIASICAPMIDRASPSPRRKRGAAVRQVSSKAAAVLAGVVVRGRDDRGHDLVMARDYIGHGIRARAQDLVTLELGPETEIERSPS
jgi:hypothetical protein